MTTINIRTAASESAARPVQVRRSRSNVSAGVYVSRASALFTSSRRKATNFARAANSSAVCICGCLHPRRTARISWRSAENRSTPTRVSRGLLPGMIPCWRIKFRGLSSGTVCKSAISVMRIGTIWTHRWSSVTGAMASRLTTLPFCTKMGVSVKCPCLPTGTTCCKKAQIRGILPLCWRAM